MNEFFVPPDLLAKPGVRMSPPPAEWREQVDGMITNAVRQIRDGKSGVFLAWVDTESGANASIVKRVVQGKHVDVDIVGYFGSTWGKPRGIRLGGAIRAEF